MTTQNTASIDAIAPSESLIDLSKAHDDSLDSALMGYAIESVEDDIVLIEFVDEFEQGNEIIRGGVVIPTSANPRAWRVGKIVLQGARATNTKKGDYVTFPNNMGIPVSNVMIKEGKKYINVAKGQFINAQRIFGKLQKIKNS